MSLRRRPWWLLIALVLGTSACGSSPTAEPTVSSAIEDVLYVGIDGVITAEGNTLTVLTDPLPAADATGSCATTVEPIVDETEHVVGVSFAVAGADPPFADCAPTARHIELNLASPVGGRRVEDPFGTTFAYAYADGIWRGCDTRMPDCNLEKAACEGSSVRSAIANLDVPGGFDIVDVRCAEPYAVADVDIAAGACPPDGDGGQQCGPARLRRVFLRIEGDKWAAISQASDAGCEQVHRADPAFPPEICEDLLALAEL